MTILCNTLGLQPHPFFDIMRFVSAANHPLEATNKEEIYKWIDEGMEDIQQGRTQPLNEAMQEVRRELTQYGV